MRRIQRWRLTARQILTKSRPGYSMLEVLVVLLIMGLLVGLVAPRVISYVGSSRTKTAAIQIENLKAAAQLYFIEHARYPTSEEGLAALQPFLQDGTAPLDPWGRPYVYKFPGEAGAEFTILSLGADGAEGGNGENADVVR